MIDLWIRAGSDGLRASGCPVGQQLFMILLSKADHYGDDQSKQLQFNVKTTHLHKPHDEFKQAGLRRLPALVHGPVHLEHSDEILEYLHANFPSPSLTYRNATADTACRDVFSKFCFYIKDVNKDPKFLEAELKKMDAYLKDNTTKFLCDDRLTYLDCEMLPKLHHIRLACSQLKGYAIPNDLTGLWRYMRNGYAHPIFRKSCPCDQEIILHWADRPDTLNLSALEHKELSKQTPTFAFDVPITVDN